MGLSKLISFQSIEDSVDINDKNLQEIASTIVHSEKINAYKKQSIDINRYLNCLCTLVMKSGTRKQNIKARIVVLASYANELFLSMILRDDTNYNKLLRQDKDSDYMNIDGLSYKNAIFLMGIHMFRLRCDPLLVDVCRLANRGL